MTTAYIYTLTDPRTNQMRYVGKTIDPERRISNHLKYANYPAVPKDWWIKKLVELGLEPVFDIIQEVSEDEWQEAEISAIAYYRELGEPLLNMTDGGDGSQGYTWTDEQREGLSQMALERWDNPEYQVNWWNGFNNRDWSFKTQEWRDKISESVGNLWENDPEYRERMCQGKAEIWNRPGYREHQVRVQKEVWDRPGYREMQAEKQSVAMSKLLQNPDYVAKQRKADSSRRGKMEAKWATEEYREYMSTFHPIGDIRKTAEILGIPKSRIYKLCQSGKLGRKIDGNWKITDEEIEQLKKERGTKC